MLCVEIIAVCRKNDRQHTNRLYGQNAEMVVLNQAEHRGEHASLYEGACPKFSINLDEILLCSYGNSEEQNKVLEPSIIIINCCIIISTAYYFFPPYGACSPIAGYGLFILELF